MVEGGFKAATVNTEQIRKWWSVRRLGNIGIPTGAVSGFVVLDIDPGGDASLASLAGQHGSLPETRTVKTGRGRQLWFKYPGVPVRCSACVLGRGLDFRGDGGYAPGGSLRRHLTAQGYSCDLLQRLGLLDSQGHDAFYRRVVFPCCQGGRVINLYGRSIAAAFAHRFLPGSKGGLYGWERVQQCPEVILVEGLFDYAVLWQAGFRHVTCSLGTHLNTYQFQQLCDRPRTIYLTFDADANGSGQQASQQLAHRLRARGISTRGVLLTDGHDPNSFFVQGGDARQFQSLLEAAQP